MKRELTEEQKRARDERRAQFKAIAKQIAGLNESQRAQLAARISVVTIEGRALSVNNTCLLAMQNPTVTMIGGFQQWRAAGRIVRKGQHGLMIWAPCKPRKAADGAVDAGESFTSDRQNFIPVTVFDVTQTEEGQWIVRGREL